MGSLNEAEKIEKNSYLSGMIVSILSILICLIAMCGSAYAYFTATLTSESNRIQAAHLCAAIEGPEADTESGVSVDDGVYTLQYEADAENSEAYREFIFTLKRCDCLTAAVTGYYELLISDGKISQNLYTQQIGKDKELQKITIRVPKGCEITVILTPQWGTYSGNDRIIGSIDIGSLFSIAPVIEEQPEEVKDAVFELGVQIVDVDAGTEVAFADGGYSLLANGQYQVTLTVADGNTDTNGYGIINVDGQTYYALFDTAQSISSMCLTVSPEKDVILLIDSEAGDLPEDVSADKLLAAGAAISIEAEAPSEGEDQPDAETPPESEDQPDAEIPSESEDQPDGEPSTEESPAEAALIESEDSSEEESSTERPADEEIVIE